jgi:hypothetical protein
MDLLIHGIYDASTLQTLRSLNVSRFGFDLRGFSSNLIPFHTLQDLIPQISGSKSYLTFENDKETTIASFLNLLGDHRHKFTLGFRDQRPLEFYQSFHHPFTWMFHPLADWASILTSDHLQALVLPLKHIEFYQDLPRLWHQVQDRMLPVILHVESFSDLGLYVREKNLTLSVDLGRDMECGFRTIDQARLQNLSVWRTTHATTAGQR